MTTINTTDGNEQQQDEDDLHEIGACGGDCYNYQAERAELREELEIEVEL